MAKLVWDQSGEKLYETGVQMGVLYPYTSDGYKPGVAWNGLTSVKENPSGAEETALYADDDKYLSLRSKEEFGFTIEAYMSPEEFDACDGTASLMAGVNIGQQTRQMFGFCYRTVLGSDTKLDAHGYKLHLVYGATAAPSERSYSTVNDSPEAMTLSWEAKTVPVEVTGHKKTSIVTIDSTKVDDDKLKILEAVLYGTNADGSTPATVPELPLPDKVIEILNGTAQSAS